MKRTRTAESNWYPNYTALINFQKLNDPHRVHRRPRRSHWNLTFTATLFMVALVMLYFGARA